MATISSDTTIILVLLCGLALILFVATQRGRDVLDVITGRVAVTRGAR